MKIVGLLLIISGFIIFFKLIRLETEKSKD